MKLFYSTIFLIALSWQLLAQNPDPAFEPMTAPGAIGIDESQHILYWQNPENVVYNQFYFSDDSALVANLDPGVLLYNGYPSTVFNSASVNSLLQNTRYFWRVVEYNATGDSLSPVWDFYSQPTPTFLYEYYFNNDLEGWEIAGPLGYYNWHWVNASHTGASPGEMAFFWDPIFIGDSYILSPEIPCPAGANILLDFRYYEDWWSDTVVVGCAITYDDGNNWLSIWELIATGNVGPSSFTTNIFPEGNFRLGFYYTGDSNNIDFLYVDDIFIATPITIAYPPSLLQAQASLNEQIVTLNWDAGIPIGVPVGYRIQRKEGLPSDNSPYVTLTETNFTTFTFNDENIELNQNYTYRISTLTGGGFTSHYGNEATAYVPAIVPVELVSFAAKVIEDKVQLNWQTATETNNSGFEVQRTSPIPSPYQGEGGEAGRGWERIGFVAGSGTTTEPTTYSFEDVNVDPGEYQYRLKQIDYDGSFEYSNTVIVEVSTPAEFSLEQNYPNPFNPKTNINFSIPVDGNVTLKIFDVLGNEVTTLVDEFKQAGNFDVIFDGSNLSSGVYYYRLTTGENVSTKKLMLMK